MEQLSVILSLKIELRPDVSGILFCTFEFEQLRNKAVEILKEAALKDIWVVSSAPLYIRVSRSFLLSLRYLLIQWGYNNSQVRVDDQAMILKVDGEECCSAFSFESELKMIWQGQFESWTDLQNNVEGTKLIDTAKAKLRRAGGKGKGGGKSNVQSTMPPWRKS